MENFFKSVNITNFKSLKSVTLSDCKRINLLIGKPNVGKSNILEALGLFGLNYSQFNINKKLSAFIRYDNTAELFFNGVTSDGDIDRPIIVVAKNEINNIEKDCILSDQGSRLEITTSLGEGCGDTFYVDSEANITTYRTDYEQWKMESHNSLFQVKPYKFTSGLILEKEHSPFLIPPFGVNILHVIQTNKQLKSDLSRILSGYGLKLLIDNASNSLRIMKPLSEDNIISFPYNSIADTLQRLIFFKAAIASNQDSILLFEEPEAHCFPPYIAHFTQGVINAETNQFFIATHSPYVLNDFMEDQETRAQLAIYMADFQDGQTVVYRLTDEELNEVYNYGIDVFFNYERFTAHG
ncbi:AAA family ATPase [Methylovulum psychrotolerans]|uniref:ATP-binding protein n=1 Tax=Methylovulum psychrotolerans TaxID=1704499 RepID=A0A2S5CQ36_9GAMM|nr:AAA family ATPase [Methylovulum psychrotolerans]POZ52905.1 ATP-binding protein [Methylovulum psychrotolerans]